MREIGIGMIVYIDNILILAKSRETAQKQAEANSLSTGMPKIYNKSVLRPTEKMDFLGITLYTVLM